MTDRLLASRYRGLTFDRTTGVKPPPGTDKLKNMLGFTVKDAMKSSIDAFNKGGYKFSLDKMTDQLFDGDVQKNFKDGVRFKGVFSIPVCEVETSDQFDDLEIDSQNSVYWGAIEKNYPDSGNRNGIQ